MNIKSLLITADVPTKNGTSYPRKVLEQVVRIQQSSIAHGMFLGELEHPETDIGCVNLQNVSHKITELTLTEHGELIGCAELLNTVSGEEVRKAIENGAEYTLVPRGVGIISEDGVIQDFQLFSVDLVKVK